MALPPPVIRILDSSMFDSISSAGYTAGLEWKPVLSDLGSIQLITDHSLNNNGLRAQADLIVGFLGGDCWDASRGSLRVGERWISAVLEAGERKLAPLRT